LARRASGSTGPGTPAILQTIFLKFVKGTCIMSQNFLTFFQFIYIVLYCCQKLPSKQSIQRCCRILTQHHKMTTFSLKQQNSLPYWSQRKTAVTTERSEKFQN
jgi:hypothetical protein